MLKNSCFILCCICLLFSCKKDILSEQELYDYLKDKDNHLFYSHQAAPFEVSLMYKPSGLLFAGNNKSGEGKANEYIYFVLNYSYENRDLLSAYSNNKAEHSRLVNELSFGLRDKINIQTDKKKMIHLVDFIHTRHYGIGSGSQILLAFDRDEVMSQSEESFDIKLKDIGIGVGNISFQIKNEAILNCPTLK